MNAIKLIHKFNLFPLRFEKKEVSVSATTTTATHIVVLFNNC